MVIAVAEGKNKWKPIPATLKKGYANILMTDSATAEMAALTKNIALGRFLI